MLALQSRAWKLMFGEMPGTELPWLWGFMRVRLLQERDPGKGNGTCASVPAGLSLWHRVLGPLCHPWVLQPLLTVEPSLGMEKVKLQVGGKLYFCGHAVSSVITVQNKRVLGVLFCCLVFFLRCGIDSMWQITEHFQ